MLERLHAMLLAVTGPDGCPLEGEALDAYLAQCLELAAAALAEGRPVTTIP